MAELTPRQIQVLRWLDENPSHRARWLVRGKAPTGRDSPDKWDAMEISGANGSIRIAEKDLRAIDGLKTINPSPDKMFGITDAARALIGR